MRLFQNGAARNRGPAYPFGALLSLAKARDVLSQMGRCPLYRATPLVDLPGLANRAKVARVLYKDESSRFGIASFKALGGAYAVVRLLQRRLAVALNRDVAVSELTDGSLASLTSSITVTCASDGNHGRAVAAAANVFHCQCRIFLHENVSEARHAAIEALGARVIRTAGTYDDSVHSCSAAARLEHWDVVSDTSTDGNDLVAQDVMQGYAVLVLEILEQLRVADEKPPTHVFLQAGVGGLAAAVMATFWEALGADAPIFIVVEPDRADCLMRSAKAGHWRKLEGPLNTVMAGLACGEPSPLAWKIIQAATEYFVTIEDESALEAMRLIAKGIDGDPGLVAGESAVAGVAALLACGAASAVASPSERVRDLRDARILLIGTEGATDPDLYRRVVGIDPLSPA